MKNLSSSFEFSISHMSMSFSMDESSLAKVVNKIIAFLSSVVSIASPEEILENPPKKQQWKNAMKKAINSFWYDKWTNEKQIKSTLEYLEIQQNPIGTPHNILRYGISWFILYEVQSKMICISSPFCSIVCLPYKYQ
jgi:hypothetical protein